MAGTSTHYDTGDCLDGPERCSGDVFPRPALSGNGEHYTRCDHHWEVYYERTAPKMDAIRARYPEMPPPDFDPLAAGERWSEDDPWPLMPDQLVGAHQ